MIKRLALLSVPALVAGVLATVTSPAGAGVPTGTATKVPVTAAANAHLNDAHLVGGASIAGSLTAAAGGALNASVAIYKGSTQVASGFTISAGHYFVGALAAYPTGYAVCVNPFFVTGGSSTTGYLGRCYTSAAFNGFTVPSTATKVPLTTGQQKTGINIKLPSAAAISGKIVNSAGAGIPDVAVTARAKSGSGNGFAFTDANGNYKFIGLPASSNGYGVCANPSGTNAGPTGYRPRCWKNVAWNGGSIPSAANAVSVSLGHTHTGIKITLPRGAAISGKVTVSGTGAAVKGAFVQAFSSTGGALGSTDTNSTGNYTIKGLGASSTNRVCVYPSTTTLTTTMVSYKGKCWKSVAYNGGSLPSGTTAVSTSLSHTHTGINFAVGKTTTTLGSISGNVNDATTPSTHLGFARVSLLTASGGFADTVTTDVNGAYHFTAVRPNATGYVVCAQADDGTTPTAGSVPDTGWAPRCYTDVAWNGGGVPGSATKVPISAGQAKTGVDIPLHVGGEISGTVNTSGLKTMPIGGVTVYLFSPTGNFLDLTSSEFGTGAYAFKGVSPSATGYLVCFDGRNVTFGQPNYLPQCYDGVSWDGGF